MMVSSKTTKNSPHDKELFQTLRHTALERTEPLGQEQPPQSQHLIESAKEWESSREKLSSIQSLLSQAYRELELMENSR
jgi:hypothetical protein